MYTLHCLSGTLPYMFENLPQGILDTNSSLMVLNNLLGSATDIVHGDIPQTIHWPTADTNFLPGKEKTTFYNF